MDLGIVGIGIAGVITNVSLFIYNLAISYSIKELRPALFLPDKRSYQELREYFKLGGAAAMELILDVWGNILMTFMAAYVSVEVQSS